MKGKFCYICYLYAITSPYLPSKKNNHATVIRLSCLVGIILVASLCFRRDPESNNTPTAKPHIQFFVWEEADT